MDALKLLPRSQMVKENIPVFLTYCLLPRSSFFYFIEIKIPEHESATLSISVSHTDLQPLSKLPYSFIHISHPDFSHPSSSNYIQNAITSHHCYTQVHYYLSPILFPKLPNLVLVNLFLPTYHLLLTLQPNISF